MLKNRIYSAAALDSKNFCGIIIVSFLTNFKGVVFLNKKQAALWGKLKAPPKPSNIPMLIHRISRTFRYSMDEECRHLGISTGMRQVLFTLSHLNEGETVTQRELASLCSVTAPTMSVTLSKMEAEGLIVREKDTADGRRIYVTLTEKGSEADKALFSRLVKKEEAMISLLSEEERIFTEGVLRKILETAEKEAKSREAL